MQTIRYILFVNRQVAPGAIVFVKADDVNLFRTDLPDMPPGHEAAGPGERWSRVAIHHTMSLDELVIYEASYWRVPRKAVEVIADHAFNVKS